MGRERRGVRIENNRIWISFMYKGIQCKESLGIEPTERNIEHAHQRIAAIKYAISINQFDYANEFPNSPRLKKFGLEYQLERGETIRERLPTFMRRHEKDRVSHSTYKGYMKSVEGILLPTFGDILVAELKPSHIAAWVKTRSKTVSRKTIANVLIPLKNMYSELSTDTGMDNPVKKVNLSLYFTQKLKAQRKHERAEGENTDIDPFSEDEVNAILSAAHGQIQNLLQFNFFTGLRTGEIIALRWDRIDFVHHTAKIDRASSLGVEAPTKTGETRIIQLVPPAIEALQRQRPFTGEKEFVFYDPGNKTPWADDQAIRKKAWVPILALAGVRYRYPYQMRHTFATTALMSGEDERWVAQQLGHSSLEMIKKNYGRHLPGRTDPTSYQTKKDWSKSLKISRFHPVEISKNVKGSDGAA